MEGFNSKRIYLIAALATAFILAILLLSKHDGADKTYGGAAPAPTEPEQAANVVDEPEQTPQPTETAEPTAQPTEEPKQPSVQTDIPSLAEAYADYFPIGAAFEPAQTQGLTGELLKKHINWVVAENAMKPASLQPSEGQFRWDQADRLVAFAKENGMALRFHTLVWHQQTPGWFFLDTEKKRMTEETDPEKREANKQLLLERLETHVRTVVERYKDDIESWDVVNEVVEPDDPDGMRNSEWYQLTGSDYIETAFRAAREAGGPDIKLYINDYNTNEPVKRDRIHRLVTELLDKGVPIDGVGHQTHISIYWPEPESVIASMQKFADLGLDNLITELDMSIYAYQDHRNYGNDIPEEILNLQGERYRDLFEALKENKDIVGGVVFWGGLSDDHTWLSTFPVARTEAPLLFDKQLQAKPAFWGIVDPSRLGP